MSQKLQMDGIKLCCPRITCKHIWTSYTESNHWVSCPFCRAGVHVKRDRANQGEEE